MNAQTAPRSRRIGALSFLALQRFSQGKCVFFPESKVRGSVAAVFAAGVAALAVLMVVMAAMNVGVILKNVVYEGGCNGGTQGTTRSTEIYLSIREADLTVGQKKKCGEEAKREIMGWKERRPRGKIGCENGFDSHAGKNIHVEDGIRL